MFPGYGPSFCPDGTKVLCIGTGGVSKGGKVARYPEILVANVDGTGIRQSTAQTWDNVHLPEWSVDGTQAVFWQTVNGPRSIQKLTLATGSISLVRKSGTNPDWTP